MVLSKLQPHLVGVVYTMRAPYEGRVGGIEFEMTRIALQTFDTTKYEFLLKTRTDVLLLEDFDFRTAIGLGPLFQLRFSEFVGLARGKFPSVSPCEVLEAWLRSAGIFRYAITLFPFDKGAVHTWMPWSPISNFEITRTHHNHVLNVCNASGWDGEDNDANFIRAMDFRLRALVRSTVSQERLVYGQGPSSMSWAERSNFIKMHTLMNEKHRLVEWDDLPPPWTDLRLRPNFCNGNCPGLAVAAESTFRLAPMLLNFTYIDLWVPVEFDAGFNPQSPWNCVNGENSELSCNTGRFENDRPVAIILRAKNTNCSIDP